MNYLNGVPDVQILGSPKTVTIEGRFNGETYAAPMEVWIAALAQVLTAEQKAAFFPLLARYQQLRESQLQDKARVVAHIGMPNLNA